MMDLRTSKNDIFTEYSDGFEDVSCLEGEHRIEKRSFSCIVGKTSKLIAENGKKRRRLKILRNQHSG